MPFHRIAEHDEREEPPEEAFHLLAEQGFGNRLIPREYGGLLGSFEELMSLMRILSRREAGLALGYGSSFFAAFPTWPWGSAAQRGFAADRLRAGAFGAIALSEDQAGSDLLATQTTAVRTPGGFCLDGEKWPIGNATRSEFVTVLARTEPGHSLLLADKSALPSDGFRHLPKVAMLGLRGHELSGIAFQRCDVPKSALIGELGQGVEMVLSGLAITRCLVGGMCLGMADTALRIAVRWALERRLYGREILALAPVREALTSAFADLLIADCVAITAARALTLRPERASLWSAVSKYLVPALCQQVVWGAAQVLSARFYMRTHVTSGMMQKLHRDIAFTGIVDGTQHVQLAAIAGQLRTLAARTGPAHPGIPELFSLATTAPAWRPPAARSGPWRADQDEITQSWRDETAPGQTAVAHLADLRRHQGTLMTEARELRWPGRPPARAYELARRHCVIHAAATCHQIWVGNRDLIGQEFAQGGWLTLCLERLRAMLGDAPSEPRSAMVDDEVAGWLLRAAEAGQMFSVIPVPQG
ncbi:acyl-CoA dehydrogenase family protein [Nonomuraea insulae]|uniref:Acyl-CoA dehydrogenase family protein n=1 Tax=Nonomuraea insulae TaxID=1616787 RepID=A0ABW1CRZ5_9ACTN